MKRFPIIGTLLLIPALALMVAVGCDKGSKSPVTPTGDSSKDGKDGDKAEKKEIAGALEATVSGTVTFKGNIPAQKEDPEIAKHKAGAECLKGKAKNINNVLDQMWLVNKDGGVANVVVSLEPPEGKKFKIDDKMKDAWKKKPAYLDQPFCAYHAHVTAIFADVQPFIVKNSSKVLTHNTSVQPGSGDKENEKSNKLLPPDSDLPPITFKFAPNPLHVSCEAHSFMTAKIVLYNHPYFAVTDEEGKFKIENAPVGEDLVVRVWHESMGNTKEKRDPVSTKKGDNPLKLEVK